MLTRIYIGYDQSMTPHETIEDLFTRITRSIMIMLTFTCFVMLDLVNKIKFP